MVRLATCLVSLLFASVACGQQTPTTTLRSNSTLILVPTLVHGASGDLAYSLTADDFRSRMMACLSESLWKIPRLSRWRW